MAMYEKLSTVRQERTINARLVSASLTGSQTSTQAGIPFGFSLISAAKTATGTYVITFLKPFVAIPVVQALPFIAGSAVNVRITAQSNSSVTLLCEVAGVATDVTGLNVTATGSDCSDAV